MILKTYSIRDAKAEVYNTPFFKKTHGEAERDFETAVRDSKTTLNKYPEDFDLYYIGEYDDNKGHLKALDTPQHVAKAIDAVEKRSQQPIQPE